MSPTDFKEKVNAITNFQESLRQITDRIAFESGLIRSDLRPIYDGVYDVSSYIKSKPRIMWVLKEPYDFVVEGEAKGGGWHIFDLYSQRRVRPTIQVMAYVIYGYRNSCYLTDIKNFSDNNIIRDALKSIAYVNVSKIPAMTVSNNHKVGSLYRQWKPLLNQQFLIYDPEIVIFGNTFSHYEKYSIGHTLDYIYKNDSYGLKVYHYDNKLLISAYHPRQREMKRSQYVDSIIKVLNYYYPLNSNSSGCLI